MDEINTPSIAADAATARLKAPKIWSLSLMGRYGRLNYLNATTLVSVALIMAAFIIGIIVNTLTNTADGITAEANMHTTAGLVIYSIGWLGAFVFCTRHLILRLHDANLKGSWVLLPYGLWVTGYLLLVAAFYAAAPGAVNLLYINGMVLYGVGIVVVLVFMLIPGTKGPNGYGEQPVRGSYAGLIIITMSCVAMIAAALYFSSRGVAWYMYI